MDNKRNISIDTLKTFALFLMVFNHVGFGNFFHTYIQSFHMPLFFLLSGYLWKNRSLSDQLKKRVKTLIIPYFSFAILYVPLCFIFDDMPFLKSFINVFTFPTNIDYMQNPALWYLICLFNSEILFTIILDRFYKYRYYIIAIISLFGFTYSSTNLPMLPFALEPTFVAILFLYIGYESKQFGLKKSSISVAILLIIFEALMAYVNKSVDLRSARYHNVILYIVNSIAGTYAWWSIISSISLSKKINELTTFIAKNGIVFVCTNQVLIKMYSSIISLYISNIIINRISVFFLSIISCMIVCQIFEKTKLKKIIGKC